jgi:integrase
MASLRKRRNKRGVVWLVDYTFGGKRSVQSTRTSDYGTAKRILQDIQGRIARGTFKLEDYQKHHVKLSDFFDEYFRYAASFKKAHTIVNERNYARKFIAFVGDQNLTNIGVRILDQWRAHQLGELSATTYNIERRTLQAAFQLAVKWKYLEQNPFKEVAKAKTEEHRLYLQDDEIARIFHLIDQDLHVVSVKKHKSFLVKYKLLILFLLNTGLRRDEALRLDRSNVDLDRRLVHIEQSKSMRMRTLPLNAAAASVLSELGEDLFQSLNRNHVSRKFAHYLRKAKLEGFKLHSLRHTFATNLVSAGVDIYAVSRLLGHSDIRTSLIYAKARMETLREAVGRLEGGKLISYKSVTTKKAGRNRAGKTGAKAIGPSPPKSDALSN